MKAKEWAEVQKKKEEFRVALVKLIERMHPPRDGEMEAARLYDSIGESYADMDIKFDEGGIAQELGYLPTAEELGELRYHFYTHNGLDAVNIASLEQPWMDNMWELIARHLKVDYYAKALELCDEVCDEYRIAVKRAMVDFVLHEPDVRTIPQSDSGVRNDPDLRAVPKPWHESFLRAKRKLLRNLHAYNPVLGYINSVWIGVFGYVGSEL